jgi:ankyrin repeat protein/WD40 repeat protein
MKKNLVILLVLFVLFINSLAATPDDDILDAAKNGDLPKAEAALKAGADVNAKTDYGITALMWASDKGHLETVKWLTANKADVNAKTKDGKTALIMASEEGHLETVKWLIANNSDVNAKTKRGDTALMMASEKGHLEIVKWLIANNADINAKDNKDNVGETALILASEKGHLEIVKLLITNNADVNAKSNGEWTALMNASRNGHLEIVKLLIANNADINAKNNVEETALIRASFAGHMEIVKLLIANNADTNAKDNVEETALIRASSHGHLEIAKWLIANKADVNAKTKRGDAALIRASEDGHLEIVKLLIANNADINAKDNDGETALIRASVKGQLEKVKWLIANNADVNAKDNNGVTALLWASSHGHLEMVKFLIVNNAELIAKNNKEETALQLAQVNKNYPVVEYLKQQEALLAKAKNIKNETGEKIKLPEWEKIQSTLEPLVFKKDYPAIEKYFKNKNANSYSESGESYLHAAMRLGDAKYTDILLKKGAKPENLDNDGSSALHIAAEKGQVNLIPILIKDKSLLTQKDAEGKSALAVSLENKKGSVSSLLLGLEKEDEIKFPVYYSKFFTYLNLSFHLQGKERQDFQNLLLEKYLDVLKKSKTNTKEISSLIWFIYKVKGETLKAKELEKKLDSNIPLVSIFANINNDNSVFAGIRTRLYEVGADYFTLQNKWKDADVFRLQVANRQYPLTAKKTPTRKESKIKKQGNLFPNEYSALDLVTQSMIEEKKEENPIQLVVQSFHTESPTQIAFNQEGNFFLTSSEDRTVKLFSDTNAKVLREYQSHDESVNAISFHPDGLQFVSGASDGILRIWDITETSPKKEKEIFKSPVTSLIFADKGKYLLAASASDGIKVFTFDDELEEIFTLKHHTSRVNSLQVNLDSSLLLSSSADKTALLYKLDWVNKTGKVISKFTNHGASVTKAILHPKKDWIITSSEDHNIYIYTKDGKLFKTLKGHSGSVTDLGLSIEASILYSSSVDNTIRAWDLEKFTSYELPNVSHSRKITGIAIQPNTANLYSISQDKSIGIWSDNAFQKVTSPGLPISDSVVSSNEEWLAAKSTDGFVKLWRMKAGNDLKYYSYPKKSESRGSIAFSPDNKVFASINSDGKIDLYSLPLEVDKEPSLLGSVKITAKSIDSIRFSADNKYLLLIMDQNKIGIFDRTKFISSVTKEIVPDNVTPEFKSKITAYSISSQNIIMTANRDGFLEAFDIQGKSLFAPKKSGHKKEIRTLAFSPSGNTLISGSLDVSDNKDFKTVKIWEISNSEIKSIKTLPETYSVESIAFSPNGEEIVVGYSNSKVQIWNWKDNKELTLSKSNHTNMVTSTHYSVDGSKVYTSSKDGSIKIWDSKLRENICTLYPFATSSLAINPSGYFDYSDPESKKNLYFIRKKELSQPIEVTLMEKSRRKVGLVKFVIEDGYRESADTIKLSNTKIKLKFPNHIDTMTEEDSKKELRFTIEPGKNSNIERVEVFLNGTLKNTFYNSDKSDKPENYPTFSYETDIRIPIITSQNWSAEQTNINSIPLLAGYNRIKIVAYDADKNIIPESNSLSIVFKISDPLKISKGDLHILAIGVNEYENGHQLKNASSDAEVSLNQIVKIAKLSDLYGNIHNTILTKKVDTTKARIIQSFDSLKNTKIQDTVIIFFSGHGQKAMDNLYYLLPSDFPWSMDSTKKEIGKDYGIHSKLISKLLEDIQASKVVLILDACYSGTLQSEFKDATTDKRAFEDMASSSGRFLLASSAGAETSLEDRDKINQGLFTYVFLNALGKRAKDGIPHADSVGGNGDSFIDMNEIGNYISSRFREQIEAIQKDQKSVEKIKYMQTPTSLISSGRYDSSEPTKVFPLGKVDK